MSVLRMPSVTSTHPITVWLALILALSVRSIHATDQLIPARIEFNRDVRPILSDNCFHCHGPDKNARQAELRLDIREEAIKSLASGAIPIVPGKPHESELSRRIHATDADEVMPPPDSRKSLTL